MADCLSKTGLQYYHNRIKQLFASATDLATLQEEVDELITEGGEPNVIEIVKVNNVALTPDANKAVNVTVPTSSSDLSDGGTIAHSSDLPTAVSDLTNDGDGTSPFATQAYVTANGGKIDVIKVNGTAQTITNKEVNLSVPVSSSDLSDGATIAHSSDIPTNVSDLTNDSGYQTASDVSTAISQAVSSVYKYKGSVATVADLPASGNTTGDVYDVQATGINYAWTGTAWDALGQLIDMSLYWSKAELVAITTAEIDTIIDGQ